MKKKFNNYTKNYPIGTIVEFSIKDKEWPFIFLNLPDGIDGVIHICDLSWSLPKSDSQFHKLKKNDKIEVVFDDLDKINHRIYFSCCDPQIQPDPKLTNAWITVFRGDVLEGKVADIYGTKAIYEFENGLLGELKFETEEELELYYEGDESVYNKCSVVSKNRNKNILELAPASEGSNLVEGEFKKTEYEDLGENAFQAREEDLLSLYNFKESIYWNFLNEEDKEKMVSYYNNNNDLFSLEVNIPEPLNFKFLLDNHSWIYSFKIGLLKKINKKNFKENDKSQIDKGLEELELSKYWFYISEHEGAIKFNMFNETLNFFGIVNKEKGFIFEIIGFKTNTVQNFYFIQKAIKNNAFLLNAPLIQIDKPLGNKAPFNFNQEDIVNKLLDKANANYLLKKAKKEAGFLLRKQGESIHIFQQFLEYEIYHANKILEINRLKLKNGIKWVSSPRDGFVAFEISFEDSEKLFEDGALVKLTKKIKSNKEDSDFEYVKVAMASVLYLDDDRAIGLTNHDNQDLTELEEYELFIENNISTSQYEVQKEIIDDYLGGKLILKNIDDLLYNPQKITVPEISLDVNFYNPFLDIKDIEENKQIEAVLKGVGNQNILLIQGPPGTGKTTVIAEIISHLVQKGERILVTSQGHVAVDNVLDKIITVKNANILRIGNSDKISGSAEYYSEAPSLKRFERLQYVLNEFKVKCLDEYISLGNLTITPFLTDLENKLIDLKANKTSVAYYLNQLNDFSLSFFSVEDAISLKEILSRWMSSYDSSFNKSLFYSSINVAFGTCIGVSRIDDTFDAFDTVIIDEAGKANISETIVALSKGKKVILVGDHKQLPPYLDSDKINPISENSFQKTKFGKNYINNFDKVKEALSVSFFEFLIQLSDKGEFPKENIVMLNYQHRMHPHIGEFVSKAFYNDLVKMGQKTFEKVLPLRPPFDKELVFVDTSSDQNPYEERVNNSYINEIEAEYIVEDVIPQLVSQNVNPKDIAVIAPYSSQVNFIKKKFLETEFVWANKIDIATLDSFQGKEYGVIIFSFTRSKQRTSVGFLDDARRLNVAFSRAEKKLILIGNAETLIDKRSHDDLLFDYTLLFNSLVEICKEETSKASFISLTDVYESPFDVFVTKHSTGTKIEGKFLYEKEDGYQFSVADGRVRVFFFDPEKKYTFETNSTLELILIKISKNSKRIDVLPKTIYEEQKRIYKDLQSKEYITGEYSFSIPSGHLFVIHAGIVAFFYDVNKRYSNIKDVVENLKILEVIPNKRKISVIPQKLYEKEENYINSLVVNNSIKGVLRKKIEIGLLFELGEGSTGLFLSYNDTFEENYIVNEKYDLVIEKINLKKKEINVIPKSIYNRRKSFCEDSSNRNKSLEATFIKQIKYGSLFELENGLGVSLLYDLYGIHGQKLEEGSSHKLVITDLIPKGNRIEVSLYDYFNRFKIFNRKVKIGETVRAKVIYNKENKTFFSTEEGVFIENEFHLKDFNEGDECEVVVTRIYRKAIFAIIRKLKGTVVEHLDNKIIFDLEKKNQGTFVNRNNRCKDNFEDNSVHDLIIMKYTDRFIQVMPLNWFILLEKSQKNISVGKKLVGIFLNKNGGKYFFETKEGIKLVHTSNSKYKVPFLEIHKEYSLYVVEIKRDVVVLLSTLKKKERIPIKEFVKNKNNIGKSFQCKMMTEVKSGYLFKLDIGVIALLRDSNKRGQFSKGQKLNLIVEDLNDVDIKVRVKLKDKR